MFGRKAKKESTPPDISQATEWLSRVTYKPNTEMLILSPGSVPDLKDQTSPVLAIHGNVLSRNGRGQFPLGSYRPLSRAELTNRSMLHQAVLSLITGREDHEAREWLCVDQQRISDPHV